MVRVGLQTNTPKSYPNLVQNDKFQPMPNS